MQHKTDQFSPLDFKTLKSILSFESFERHLSEREYEGLVGMGPNELSNAICHVTALGSFHAEKLLLELTEDALGSGGFYKASIWTGSLNGKVYLSHLTEIFSGTAQLDVFNKLCGNMYQEMLALNQFDSRKYSLFQDVLPASFYTQPKVTGLIENLIWEIIQNKITLLPDFKDLPGFKQFFCKFMPNADNSHMIKCSLYCFLRELDSGRSSIEIKECGSRISSAMHMLQIAGIMKDPAFINLVGLNINFALKNSDLTAANNFFCLLPRDPDNNFKLIPIAQEMVSNHEKQAYECICKALRSEYLNSVDFPLIAGTIRNFIPLKVRSDIKLCRFIKHALIELLPNDGSISGAVKLIKSLPFKAKEDILDNSKIVSAAQEGAELDIDYFNSLSGSIDDFSPVHREQYLRHYQGFIADASYLLLDITRLKDLPEGFLASNEDYHYACGLCEAREHLRPFVRRSHYTVNRLSWKNLILRAEELYNQGRHQISEIYAYRALNSMSAVPDLGAEAHAVAKLFNLCGRLSKSAEKQSIWQRRETRFKRVSGLADFPKWENDC